jgi:hypothetical protein
VQEIENKEDDEPISFKKFFELSRVLIFIRRVMDRILVIPMFETFLVN